MTATSPIDLPAPAASTAGEGVARHWATRFGFPFTIVAQILMLVGASAPSPFYPVLADDIGFGTGVIGVVFAVYAVTLLVTLLSTGSLSDHIGRRPLAITGFVILAASMFAFWHADSVALLIIARIAQGVASGLLISALSAATLDFAPGGRASTAALWNALAPGIGLAGGALISGVALEATSAALAGVFAALTIAYLVCAALFALIPETSPRLVGAWGSLRFRLSIPPSVRSDFWRSAPAIIAGWATGGLFLSLGANFVRDLPGGGDHFLQALPVVLVAGVGAIAAFSMRRRSPHVTIIFASVALAAGTAVSLVAFVLASLPLYLVGVVITGMGFGTAFSGVLGALTPRIPAAARADTFAVIFLIAYLAFSIPAVVAGILIGLVGLGPVCVGYGAVVIVLALAALGLRLRSGARTK